MINDRYKKKDKEELTPLWRGMVILLIVLIVGLSAYNYTFDCPQTSGFVFCYPNWWPVTPEY